MDQLIKERSKLVNPRLREQKDYSAGWKMERSPSDEALWQRIQAENDRKLAQAGKRVNEAAAAETSQAQYDQGALLDLFAAAGDPGASPQATATMAQPRNPIVSASRVKAAIAAAERAEPPVVAKKPKRKLAPPVAAKPAARESDKHDRDDKHAMDDQKETPVAGTAGTAGKGPKKLNLAFMNTLNAALVGGPTSAAGARPRVSTVHGRTVSRRGAQDRGVDLSAPVQDYVPKLDNSLLKAKSKVAAKRSRARPHLRHYADQIRQHGDLYTEEAMTIEPMSIQRQRSYTLASTPTGSRTRLQPPAEPDLVPMQTGESEEETRTEIKSPAETTHDKPRAAFQLYDDDDDGSSIVSAAAQTDTAAGYFSVDDVDSSTVTHATVDSMQTHADNLGADNSPAVSSLTDEQRASAADNEDQNDIDDRDNMGDHPSEPAPNTSPTLAKATRLMSGHMSIRPPPGGIFLPPVAVPRKRIESLDLNDDSLSQAVINARLEAAVALPDVAEENDHRDMDDDNLDMDDDLDDLDSGSMFDRTPEVEGTMQQADRKRRDNSRYRSISNPTRPSHSILKMTTASQAALSTERNSHENLLAATRAEEEEEDGIESPSELVKSLSLSPLMLRKDSSGYVARTAELDRRPTLTKGIRIKRRNLRRLKERHTDAALRNTGNDGEEDKDPVPMEQTEENVLRGQAQARQPSASSDTGVAVEQVDAPEVDESGNWSIVSRHGSVHGKTRKRDPQRAVVKLMRAAEDDVNDQCGNTEEVDVDSIADDKHDNDRDDNAEEVDVDSIVDHRPSTTAIRNLADKRDRNADNSARVLDTERDPTVQPVDEGYLKVSLGQSAADLLESESADNSVDVTGPSSPEVKQLLHEASTTALIPAKHSAADADNSRVTPLAERAKTFSLLASPVAADRLADNSDESEDPSIPPWKRELLRKRRAKSSAALTPMTTTEKDMTKEEQQPEADPASWRQRLRSSRSASAANLHESPVPAAGEKTQDSLPAKVNPSIKAAVSIVPAVGQSSVATASTTAPAGIHASSAARRSSPTTVNRSRVTTLGAGAGQPAEQHRAKSQETESTDPPMLSPFKQKTYSQVELDAMPPWKREFVLRKMRKTAV
eukprot:TRINITY_DN5457_c0_g1_i1.p1 TRINITY_DN5457_c0_g1~~TRINITY_DN5457_c0_g1_i1.p1  ORF type:complete len:1111 (+),score=293.16 TRINITY_DN5457_c0_g1_i1:128-3460(+)